MTIPTRGDIFVAKIRFSLKRNQVQKLVTKIFGNSIFVVLPRNLLIINIKLNMSDAKLKINSKLHPL